MTNPAITKGFLASLRAALGPTIDELVGKTPHTVPQPGLTREDMGDQGFAAAMEESPGNARVTVDLERQVVVTPWGEAVPFAVDARKRAALLSGLDEIAQTLQRAAEIAAWQARYQAVRRWAWDSVGRG